jgi:hypothetical protein
LAVQQGSNLLNVEQANERLDAAGIRYRSPLPHSKFPPTAITAIGFA